MQAPYCIVCMCERREGGRERKRERERGRERRGERERQRYAVFTRYNHIMYVPVF